MRQHRRIRYCVSAELCGKLVTRRFVGVSCVKCIIMIAKCFEIYGSTGYFLWARRSIQRFYCGRGTVRLSEDNIRFAFHRAYYVKWRRCFAACVFSGHCSREWLQCGVVLLVYLCRRPLLIYWLNLGRHRAAPQNHRSFWLTSLSPAMGLLFNLRCFSLASTVTAVYRRWTVSDDLSLITSSLSASHRLSICLSLGFSDDEGIIHFYHFLKVELLLLLLLSVHLYSALSLQIPNALHALCQYLANRTHLSDRLK